MNVTDRARLAGTIIPSCAMIYKTLSAGADFYTIMVHTTPVAVIRMA